MCGIAGLVDFQPSPSEARVARLTRAIGTLRRRGPDGAAIWAGEDGAGMAHARLSIIDLSETGDQPMRSSDGRMTIVFNGELYNHRELRLALEALGWRFRGTSDTEVVLNAFDAWGPRCVERLIGMFAFALWDSRERRMTLCRDRAGVKPLYFRVDRLGLQFGSELKALRAMDPDRELEIDRYSVGRFLQFGYIPSPTTIYAGVEKVAPGCLLEIEVGGRRKLTRYWDISEFAAAGPSRKLDDIVDELEALVVEAVRYRLVSDVPLGLFLSGGVDSTLVASVLVKKLDCPLTAFTVGFDESAHDETAAARETAGLLGLDHRITKLSWADVEALLADWSDLYDEPFDDASGFPTFAVSKLAASEFKVVLSGDGGDELFGGYAGYLTVPRQMAALRAIPAPVRATGASGLRSLSGSALFDLRSNLGRRVARGAGQGWLFDRINRAAGMLAASNEGTLRNRFSSRWQPHEISRLLGIDYRDDEPAWDGRRSTIEELMCWDFQRYLPDEVLTKVDRASMANGLEAREPLLDHRLIEFAFRLPLEHRISRNLGKPLLRKLLTRYLPEDVCYRPKAGFSVPLQDWVSRLIEGGAWTGLREGGWNAASDLIDPEMMEGAYRSLSGSTVGANRLWILLVLQQWAARWRGGQTLEPGPVPIRLLAA